VSLGFQIPIQRQQNLRVIVGDVANREAVEQAVVNQEVVLSAVGARSLLRRESQLTLGVHNIVVAMEQAKTPRLIYLSADTVHDMRHELNPLRRYLVIPILLHNTAADHELDEAITRQSRLDWVIVRPPVLTNGPRTGAYRSGEHLQTKAVIPSISRADVAEFMLNQLTDNAFLHRTPSVVH
jgi:putative NADH-flavin reductase